MVETLVRNTLRSDDFLGDLRLILPKREGSGKFIDNRSEGLRALETTWRSEAEMSLEC